MSRPFNELCYTNEGKGSYITLKDLKRFLENIDPDGYEIERLIAIIKETLKERKETP